MAGRPGPVQGIVAQRVGQFNAQETMTGRWVGASGWNVGNRHDLWLDKPAPISRARVRTCTTPSFTPPCYCRSCYKKGIPWTASTTLEECGPR